MAGKNRYFNTRFWDDPYIVELPIEEKLLFIYLITNPSANIAGIYEITFRKISFDTGIGFERLSKAFEGFEKAGKAFYYSEYNYVFVTNTIKHQKLNSNIIKGIHAIIKDLPDGFLEYMGKASKAFQSLSKALNNINLNININLNLNNKENLKVSSRHVNYLEGYSENFLKAFYAFSEMRDKLGKPLSDSTSQLLLKKLHCLSTVESEKVQILNNSTISCYPDIYPLKKETSLKPLSSGTNPVINYEKSKQLEREVLENIGDTQGLKERGYVNP